MWFIILSAGAVIGFGIAACMSAASKADENLRRCRNCRHGVPLPEGTPDYFAGCLNCTSCRGEDYDLPKEGVTVSTVSPEGFCNEFCERGG